MSGAHRGRTARSGDVVEAVDLERRDEHAELRYHDDPRVSLDQLDRRGALPTDDACHSAHRT